MINSKDIAPGTTVYTARRGLEARHDILFTVQERVVQKRTPKGYAIQSPYFRNGMRHAIRCRMHDYLTGVEIP